MLRFLKQIKYLEHYALWVFMFLFVFDVHFWDDEWLEAISFTLLELFVYVLIFYLNYLLFIPLFLAKGKKINYFLSIIFFLILHILGIKISGLEWYLYEISFWRNILSMTINFGLFWLVSTLYWYYKKLQEEREMQLTLQTEKLAAELRFLKNQLSPHFIFNTLNNIYSLVQQGHKNAAPMLAQLSTILRYILYESSKDKVLLSKELATIKEYIELQLYRKPASTNVDFYQEGLLENYQIIPLLLLNFVENCFKHGNLDQSETAWIKISCIISDAGQLEFITENSKDKITLKQDIGGIGNTNIQRQLLLNYADAHELITTVEEDVYKIKLTLQL